MPKKVFNNFNCLFCAFLLIAQFSCRERQNNLVDYEAELVADSAANSFMRTGQLDVFMQLSKDVIKARLDNYGFTEEDYNLEISGNKLLVKVYNLDTASTGAEARSVLPVQQLVTSEGSFRIFETYESNESILFLVKLDSALKSVDTAASVYDLVFVPEYYEDDEVVYHPTPVAGFVPVHNLDSFFTLVRFYREDLQLPEELRFMPLRRQQGNLKGIVAVRNRYSDSSLVLLDQSYVRNVSVDKDGGRVTLKIELNETGTGIFTGLSLDNENRSLAIALDEEVLFYPRLTDLITDGILQFSTDLPFPVARALAIVINMKQLPLVVQVVSEEVKASYP